MSIFIASPGYEEKKRRVISIVSPAAVLLPSSSSARPAAFPPTAASASFLLGLGKTAAEERQQRESYLKAKRAEHERRNWRQQWSKRTAESTSGLGGLTLSRRRGRLCWKCLETLSRPLWIRGGAAACCFGNSGLVGERRTDSNVVVVVVRCNKFEEDVQGERGQPT